MKAEEFVESRQHVGPIDIEQADSVGFQTSYDGQRVWLCINGQCLVRVKGIKQLQFQMDHVMGATNVRG